MKIVAGDAGTLQITCQKVVNIHMTSIEGWGPYKHMRVVKKGKNDPKMRF